MERRTRFQPVLEHEGYVETFAAGVRIIGEFLVVSSLGKKGYGEDGACYRCG